MSHQQQESDATGVVVDRKAQTWSTMDKKLLICSNNGDIEGVMAAITFHWPGGKSAVESEKSLFQKNVRERQEAKSINVCKRLHQYGMSYIVFLAALAAVHLPFKGGE